MQGNLHVTVSALVAAAVVWTAELPVRLNPIILPLMACIKREQVTFREVYCFCTHHTHILSHICIFTLISK